MSLVASADVGVLVTLAVDPQLPLQQLPWTQGGISKSKIQTLLDFVPSIPSILSVGLVSVVAAMWYTDT